jgi:hypothetical protein
MAKSSRRENNMSYQDLIAAIAVSMLSMHLGGAQAADDAKYPDFNGQWARVVTPGVSGQPSFDQTKSWGLAQQVPLTPEYQAILEASVANQAAGGQGDDGGFTCLPYGMPRMMNVYTPMEIIVSPGTIHILINDEDHGRRIYTDGRDWPRQIEPTFQGYSIGRWIDAGGDGRYNVLEVETRGFKGPRTYDATGIPLHRDNQSVFKERIYLDKADPNILHDEITVIDNALTRPFTVDKRFRRNLNPRPTWAENICAENNGHVVIGNQNYMLSAGGLLMPSRKNQAPPDLKYFNQSRK